MLGQPLAIGCMRLSTEKGRDEARGLATIHAALDAGVTLLDTADAYCLDASETGHNERLIARALASWPGDASRVRVATKGGLTRPGGRWENDGRARHLRAACEASLEALGVPRIHLYQLHAPDPAVPLATSVRALAALQRDGLVEQVGLCNVSVGQLREARALVEIASVQIELGPWQEAGLRSGVAEYCQAEGIALLAYRPLGGSAGARRLAQDVVLRVVADRHGGTPAEVALAWLRGLASIVVPLPGPTRPESAASLARVAAWPLTDDDRARLDQRFPAARVLRVSRARREPRPDAPGDVVLIAGLPGAGKSTLAGDLVRDGYERLNRDDAGGRLADLLPALSAHLAAGRMRVVLDNTYGSRAARNAVIETAWAHGVPARCIVLRTSMEDAQVNAARRIFLRHGRLLEPDELKAAARKDPSTLAPQVLFRHRREFEEPDPAEGFARLDEVAFERRRPQGYDVHARVVRLDGLDADTIRRLAGGHPRGGRLLGVAWGSAPPAPAGFDDTVRCTHAGDGPAVCWCRRPLPGLGVVLIERHRLDPAGCVYVGREPSDQAFARALGFAFQPADELFRG